MDVGFNTHQDRSPTTAGCGLIRWKRPLCLGLLQLYIIRTQPAEVRFLPKCCIVVVAFVILRVYR